MKQFYLVCILLAFPLLLTAKPDKAQLYQRADSVALSIRKTWFNPYNLSQRLTQNLDSEEEKVRAIYRWVSENISFDCKAWHHPERQTENVRQILWRRKATSKGYALLFKELCEYADITSYVIEGYAKTNRSRIGKNKRIPNHAWNAVWINDNWYLLDVSWSSGSTDDQVRRFTRHFNDYYFLTAPDKFALNHYPKDEDWMLEDIAIEKDEYESFPMVSNGFHANEIEAFEPSMGTIRVDLNDEIQFKFKFDEKPSSRRVALDDSDSSR